MKRQWILGAVLAVACATSDAPTQNEPQRLHQTFDDYFEQLLILNPVLGSSIGDHRYNHVFTVAISDEFRRKSRAVDLEYLDRISKIDRNRLGDQDRLSYDIFKRQLQNSLRGYEYPSYLVPLNQFFGTPNFFAQLGSGSSVHPFKTVDDYEDFLSRINGFVQYADTAIVNMREGVRRGLVQPRVIMEKTLPQLQAHVVSDPEKSIFYTPIRNLPASFSDADKGRLTARYREAILQQVVPAYRKLHDFVRDEYMTSTRSTVGMSAVPGGADWYRFLVQTTTTTDLTPEQIHDVGLSEVKRIHGEMEKLASRTGFNGTLQQFFDFIEAKPELYFESREDLLANYRNLKATVDTESARLFDVRPKSDYEIRPVEEFRERSFASGAYQSAPPDGSRPGVFYVNTYDLKARPKTAMTSLLMHEGSPGHHFQIMIQRELENLPKFRRFGGYGAYVEGWGLYAESLGHEVGLYEDPYQYYGQLEAELWRAIRLVLDTGIHARGWTREQAIDFARQNSAVDDTRITSEVERFIAIPSQALAYKIGQLKITELRRRAERELGNGFDVKEFHRQVLVDGALPLDVLEAKINRWIASKK